ncbi:uncharacterized protein LOC131960637 [Centropristis striata]|uniref:uncharacterized protein LOC131960637 n=1 Tax=Centropristis striata TaxID=184440 RepID=UPI0027DF7358|nr:uncharacterized protein LOC131960637 [Centropristis striata]
MNWVGGSRNRVVMKNDAKKQREFFEKRKMQQRLKTLGIALPASPRSSSSGSMDLVTLFIVNQIAAKKEVKDPPKVAVLGSSKGGSKHKRNEPLVLPMSPCSPSQLNLVEGQPQHSVQGTRKRKNVIPQGAKCRQLSPVLESAFSDNSASDYLPPKTDPLSPFSSNSSASSGQGVFPLPLKKQRSQAHCSPPPWDTSGLEQNKFQPFSQPRGITDSIPWSYGSNPPPYQLETPTAAKVLFRNPEPDNMEARDQARHEATLSLNKPPDREPMLDFTINQSETDQQIDSDLFRGFSKTEASHFGRGKPKIYLKNETPAESSAPQTVPDSQCMEVERNNHMHNLSNCSDMNFQACLEHNKGLMNGCEYSPSYSCRGGCLSSDCNDDDDKDHCEPCLQATSACMDQASSVDGPNPNLGPQANPNQRHTKPRPPTPLLRPQRNIRDNPKIVEKASSPVKASESNRQHTGSNTALLESPQSQSSELCKCKKKSNETQDAGTQTVYDTTAETCDASTQCSFVLDSETKASGYNLCLPLVEVSVQHPATGRQTDTAAEPSAHTPSAGKESSGDKYTPWTENISRAGFQSGCSLINIGDGKVNLQRDINPFLYVSMAGGRGKENQEGRDERGQQENGRLMKDVSNEVKEEVTSATRANRLPEEAETLQEIADILLLLKQRKEVRK